MNDNRRQAAAAFEPLPLAQALIRCPSVTPDDAGALSALEQALSPLGFACRRLRFEGPGSAPVENLVARFGDQGPNFGFAGHVDVVPPGDLAGWSVDPFAAEIAHGRLYGRGAADMKTAIACFVTACAQFLAERGGDIAGSLTLLVTADEEGPAVNGTARMLEWMVERGERIDCCLVGEPTNPHVLGEMLKIGRRGSLNAVVTARGVQGHAAYPARADNPIPDLVRLLARLGDDALDAGSDHFEPSTLTITSIDVGNPVTNVIPAEARAMFNIRFNDRHTAAGLTRRLLDHCDAVSDRFSLATECSGESFLSPPETLADIVTDAVRRVTGRTPEFSTSGGTSDARFLHRMCPVVEFGLVGETAHKVNENVALVDVAALTDIYRTVLHSFFDRRCGSRASSKR